MSGLQPMGVIRAIHFSWRIKAAFGHFADSNPAWALLLWWQWWDRVKWQQVLQWPATGSRSELVIELLRAFPKVVLAPKRKMRLN